MRVVCDVGHSDVHIAVNGACGDDLDFNRVDSVVGDVLGGLWFKVMSIFVLDVIDDV